MSQYVFGLSSGIIVDTLWLWLIFAVWSIDPCFVMDRGQSLIIPPLFDGINYVWQVIEIG